MEFSAILAETTGLRSDVVKQVASVADDVLRLSRSIHADPELSFQEHRASVLISARLEDAGFEVERGVADLGTAFVATAGSGPLTVAVCVEYDSLPNIGHACGHNIIAGASVAAALALLPLVDDLDITLRVIGTPAEEHGGGKVVLLERGVFDGVGVAMMTHPVQDGMSYNPEGTTSQAVGRYRATFRGTAAHAAAAPHLGVNAADAAVLSQVAVGLLRQQIPSDHRIALYVSEAGFATNIIPDTAVVEFECRAFTLTQYEALLVRVRRCFEAGALATGATLEFEQTEPLYEPLLQDAVLCAHWNEGMAFFGRNVERSAGLSGGSTDMGNISQVIPSIHPWVGIPGAQVPIHSHGFAAVADTPEAYEIMFESAIAMAWTVIGVSTDADQRETFIAAAQSRSTAQTTEEIR